MGRFRVAARRRVTEEVRHRWAPAHRRVCLHRRPGQALTRRPQTRPSAQLGHVPRSEGRWTARPRAQARCTSTGYVASPTHMPRSPSAPPAIPRVTGEPRVITATPTSTNASSPPTWSHSPLDALGSTANPVPEVIVPAAAPMPKAAAARGTADLRQKNRSSETSTKGTPMRIQGHQAGAWTRQSSPSSEVLRASTMSGIIQWARSIPPGRARTRLSCHVTLGPDERRCQPTAWRDRRVTSPAPPAVGADTFTSTPPGVTRANGSRRYPRMIAVWPGATVRRTARSLS
jgi:hypothetical protein